MNRKDVIKYCMELPSVYEDYPFLDDNDSVTMKHKNNKKEIRRGFKKIYISRKIN